MGINGNPEQGRGTRGKFLGFKEAPSFGWGVSLFGCTYSKIFADVGGYYKPGIAGYRPEDDSYSKSRVGTFRTYSSAFECVRNFFATTERPCVH